MIGSLSGTIIHKQVQELWLEVGGVGYRVFVGERLLERAVLGQTLKLWIHTRTREDTLELYGFEDVASLNIFERLLNASGVGPKTALAIVGQSTGEAIAQAIASANVDFFRQFKGVGKKGAQRIIVDLKGKLGSLAELNLSEASGEDQEVIEVLVGFGFQLTYVEQIVSDLDKSLSVEDKIREGLKRLGRK